MEKRSILLKYGELILKGANKSYFDATLLRQIRRKLKPLGEFRVFTSQSTVFVESEDDALLDLALPAMVLYHIAWAVPTLALPLVKKY